MANACEMKTFSYLALVTAQHQKTAKLALGGNRALKGFGNKQKNYFELKTLFLRIFQDKYSYKPFG